MKRNKLIVGAIGVIAAGAIFSTLPLGLNSVGSYKKKSLSSLEMRSATEAQNWLAARYIDQSTGEPVTAQKLSEIRTQIAKMSKSKAISFIEQGPDNIGGRTRAIQIDIDNVSRVWAGGVSGGLFVSTNRANTWERVDSYIDAGASPFISSMTQTPDGTLFVATGSGAESFGGNGVWYSTDKGVSWDKIPGTTICNEVEASTADNYVWMATSGGLKKWKLGDASVTSVTVASGSCNSLKVSEDGQVLVAAISSNKNVCLK